MLCDNITQIEGERIISLGIIYILHGSLYYLTYIPCIVAMTTEKLISNSAFKIMFVMGIIDITNLFINCFVSGFYSLVGASYCTYRTSMIVFGTVAMGFWTAYCACCVILAINRLIDLCSPKWARFLFEERRTWFWMIIPVLYGSYFASPLSLPLIYNSPNGVWLFTIDLDGPPLFNTAHTVNNVGTFVALVFIYLLIVVAFMRLTKEHRMENTRALQKQVMLQSFLICLLAMFATISYVLIKFDFFPLNLDKYAQLSWQACHGGNSIIYLLMNKTIKDNVRARLKIFLCCKRQTWEPTFTNAFKSNKNQVIPINTTSHIQLY